MFRQNGEIDVIKIANQEGLKVVAEDSPDDYNAHIEFDSAKNTFTIFVNANHSYNRVKFSIAHELAHYLLHKDLVKKYLKIQRSNTDHLDAKVEREANELAAEILLPKQLLDEKISEVSEKDSVITAQILEKLVDTFKVSKEAMSIRLDRLGYVLVS